MKSAWSARARSSLTSAEYAVCPILRCAHPRALVGLRGDASRPLAPARRAAGDTPTHRRRSDAEGSIGYLLDPAVHGRGLSTEIGAALLALAFEDLGLHRVTAGCFAGNIAATPTRSWGTNGAPVRAAKPGRARPQRRGRLSTDAAYRPRTPADDKR
ncbi:GNAT family protein [Nostocoides vanveenii]|uniref:GNAT family N-acetyltransferase n=1 Tax=Nostocoides vanveenii TaxID=330835 RepID=UPI0031DC3999